MSENVRDLLARMMCVDPAARIKMPELCEHPWFLEDEEDPIDLFADLKPVNFVSHAVDYQEDRACSCVFMHF